MKPVRCCGLTVQMKLMLSFEEKCKWTNGEPFKS